MPKRKTETDHIEQTLAALVQAALPHVGFDGWSAETLRLAIEDSGVDAGLAALACPRGAIDLALGFHRSGDRAMADAMMAEDQTHLRYSERVARAVQLRLQDTDKEAVRRGVTLFALPQNAGEGAKAIWGTVDTIWNTLGDTSEDLNWYTKRATLGGVYSSTVLFWLGDDSDGAAETWAFLDRRIENVMQFEKLKGSLMRSPIGKLAEGFVSRVRKPDFSSRTDLPGFVQK